MSISALVPPGQLIAGKYRIEAHLGEGGMGSVLLVRHALTDERLALKLLHADCLSDPSLVERFRREARAPARIDSDHVVRVTDADVAPELGGVPFLVMEYLKGRDLDHELAARGALQPVEVVLYLRQAARALDKAHALGIVHRDLKPENLFLTEREDGTPWIKLLDFGIAKVTGGAAGGLSGGSRTRTGAVFGTPLYMAPEQTKGDPSQICAQTDIWALGIITHKLLSGRDLWSGETIAALISQIAFEPMPVPSARGLTLGASYDAWFQCCCARDPRARYRTAGDAVAALAGALGIVEGPELTGAVAEVRRAATAAPSMALCGGPGATPHPAGGAPPPPSPAVRATVAATPAAVAMEPEEELPTAARGLRSAAAACAPSGSGTVAGGVPPIALLTGAAVSSLASSAAPFATSNRALPTATRGMKPAVAVLIAATVGIATAALAGFVMLRSSSAPDAQAEDEPTAIEHPSPAAAPDPDVASGAPTTDQALAPPTATSSASAGATTAAPTSSPQPKSTTSPRAAVSAKPRATRTAGASASPTKKPSDDELLSGR